MQSCGVFRSLECSLEDADSCSFLRRGIDGRSGPVLRARGRIVRALCVF